jgi:hypothetical protein
MGNYCSLCCYVCCKNTLYSLELADSILYKMEKHIRENIPIGSGIQTWFISLKRECFNQFRQSLACRISMQLEELHFPVLTSNGNMKQHFAENFAYVISSCLFNENFAKNIYSNIDYECLNIPTNTLFYNCPKIDVNNETQSNLINYITNIMDENGKISNIPLDTTDKTHHKIFDSKLESRLIEILHKIQNNKVEKIISSVYTNFTDKNTKEEEILKINRKSIKENSKKEEIRYTNFV